MTKLTAKQEARVRAVKAAKENIDISLALLEEEHAQRVHITKAPVHRAVEAAMHEKVPFNTIVKEGLGFTYPAKGKAWLAPPDITEYTDAVTQANQPQGVAKPLGIEVVRDNGEGTITVHVGSEQYVVQTYGPDGEWWSSVDSSVPQEVRDAIKDKYPFWQCIDEDEE